MGNFQHVFPWAELVVIGGWIDREYDRVIDFGIPVDFTSDQKIVSGEGRLADAGEKTTWVAGLYYKKWDQDNALVLVDAVAPGIDFSNLVFFNTEDKSIFGEATRYFNDKWSGTLGARVFDEDKHDPFMVVVGGGIGVVEESDLDSSASDVLPKLGLAYDASERVKLYFNYAEGYRPGGVNPIFVDDPSYTRYVRRGHQPRASSSVSSPRLPPGNWSSTPRCSTSTGRTCRSAARRRTPRSASPPTPATRTPRGSRPSSPPDRCRASTSRSPVH